MAPVEAFSTMVSLVPMVTAVGSRDEASEPSGVAHQLRGRHVFRGRGVQLHNNHRAAPVF